MFIHKVCNALDKAIKWTQKNLEEAEKALNGLGLVSLLPINATNLFQFRDEYVKNKNLIAWHFYDRSNPIQQVDLLINFDLKGQRVDLIQTQEGKIKVLSLKDLIAMKKATGRPQDIEDVKFLEAL